LSRIYQVVAGGIEDAQNARFRWIRVRYTTDPLTECKSGQITEANILYDSPVTRVMS
jgi:hypothetical protein